MENLDQPQAEKKLRSEGTNDWIRVTNPDGTVSSFETQEEYNKYKEELRGNKESSFNQD